MPKEIFKELLKNSPIVKDVYHYAKELESDDPAHDFSHSLRVLGNALALSKKEGGDREALAIAALLHDAKNLPKSHPEAHLSSKISAEHARTFLLERGFLPKKIDIVYDAIFSHSFTLGKIPATLEGKILQDADRIDGLGIIGVMRAFAVSGRMGAKFYHPEDPFFQTVRELCDKRYTIDHFYQKLFLLSKMMQTATGRKIALERTEKMNHFLDELAEEIFLFSE